MKHGPSQKDTERLIPGRVDGIGSASLKHSTTM
jgi:hypothetical protein